MVICGQVHEEKNVFIKYSLGCVRVMVKKLKLKHIWPSYGVKIMRKGSQDDNPSEYIGWVKRFERVNGRRKAHSILGK